MSRSNEERRESAITQLLETVERCAVRARESHDSNDALRFTQAATNASHAYAQLCVNKSTSQKVKKEKSR